MTNDLPRSPLQSAARLSSEDELGSEVGIDYTWLRDFLSAGEWKLADEETWNVLRQAVYDEATPHTPFPPIETIPSLDLQTIDQLWVKYSRGRFGFSVQKQIYLQCGGKPNRQIDLVALYKFASRVGWMADGIWHRSYEFALCAPHGHLPSAHIGYMPMRNGVIFYLRWWQLFARDELNVDDLDFASLQSSDYLFLRELLKAGEWQLADQETHRLMEVFTQRKQAGRLGLEGIQDFLYNDLRLIDQLWVKYSQGHFGFSVQQQIYLDSGGKPDRRCDRLVWDKFGDRVGWRSKGVWLNYQELMFTHARKEI